MTATAIPYIEKRIIQSLQMKNPAKITSNPDRENLVYSVTRLAGKEFTSGFKWLADEILHNGLNTKKCLNHRDF